MVRRVQECNFEYVSVGPNGVEFVYDVVFEQLEFDFSGMGVPRYGRPINKPEAEEWDPQF